jgi:hypothetical protein
VHSKLYRLVYKLIRNTSRAQWEHDLFLLLFSNELWGSYVIELLFTLSLEAFSIRNKAVLCQFYGVCDY